MNNKNKKTLTPADCKRINRRLKAVLSVVCLTPILGLTAFATSAADPLAPVTSFANLLVSLVQIFGFCVTLFGAVQVGMSFQSHDSSQRSQGFLVLIGGVIIALAPTILSYIGISL